MEKGSRRQFAGTVACLLVACMFAGATLRAQDCDSECPAGGWPANCTPPYCSSGIYNGDGCCCDSQTPIVVDVDGRGFFLTSLADGVDFDIADRLYVNRVSWTQQASTNAWLALDRNGDGKIDMASELFGNLAPQPPPPPGVPRNGFLALAVFDQPDHGGNGNGMIDPGDAVYSHLRLWQDFNHDGVSTPDELKTLPELGIAGISLQYTLSRHTDQYGNVFRYVGTIYRTDGSTSHDIVDVIIQVGARVGPAADGSPSSPPSPGPTP
jgi:hypothetical protein